MTRSRRVLVYLVLSGTAIAAFVAIRWAGQELTAPAPAAAAPATAAREATGPDVLIHVLLALLVVMLVSRCIAVVLGRLRQPPVMGEIIAGIMLGPSLLGRVSPEATA